jgi:hypothetical protein
MQINRTLATQADILSPFRLDQKSYLFKNTLTGKWNAGRLAFHISFKSDSNRTM